MSWALLGLLVIVSAFVGGVMMIREPPDVPTPPATQRDVDWQETAFTAEAPLMLLVV